MTFGGANAQVGHQVAGELARVEESRAGIGRVIEWIPIAGQIFANELNKAAESAKALGEAHKMVVTDARQLSVTFAAVKGNPVEAMKLEHTFAVEDKQAQILEKAKGMGLAETEKDRQGLANLPTTQAEITKQKAFADQRIAEIQKEKSEYDKQHISTEYEDAQFEKKIGKWTRRKELLGMQENIFGDKGLKVVQGEQEKINASQFEAQKFGIASGTATATLTGRAASARFDRDPTRALAAEMAGERVAKEAEWKARLAAIPEGSERYKLEEKRVAAENEALGSKQALQAQQFAENPGMAVITSARESQGSFGLGPQAQTAILTNMNEQFTEMVKLMTALLAAAKN